MDGKIYKIHIMEEIDKDWLFYWDDTPPKQ